MVTLRHHVQTHPEVVDTELDDNEVVLLHLERKTYFSLNPTGGRIWAGLKQGLTLGEVSQRIQEVFEVEADRADRSVLELVEDLAKQDLVRVAD